MSRLLGNQGTDFPGRVARKIYPDILRALSGRVKKGTILITGTNGKTTTSNLIASVIRESGLNLVHNQAGANMMAGITTAFIEAAPVFKASCFDYALLETDEANVPLLLNEIHADFLVVTNFFRDQLDRYGELDTTVAVIREAARKYSLEVLLNADDPLSAAFRNQDLILHFYGFDHTVYDSRESRESREGRFCLQCGAELAYLRFHYAQLGKFKCPGCGQENPEPKFLGSGLRMEPLVEFRVEDARIRSNYQGFFNAYNLLAAFSMSRLLGIESPIIEKALSNHRPRAGRMESFEIGGKECMLVLVKNPTGLNQSLSALLNTPGVKDIFFALNDNAADGRDVSWIWDADMEMIDSRQQDINMMVCSGQRSGDIAVRAKYAGLDTRKIILEPDLKAGIKKAVSGPGERAYILCTYTALFAARKIMVRLQKESPGETPLRARRPGS